MKCVIFSDIQYNNWEEFSRTLPNGINSRFQDQLNVQEEIFEFAKAQKATGEDVLLIHTGDLFESMTEKISKQVFLNVFDKFATFSKEQIPIVLLVGNHDWVDKTETSHMIEPFKEIENVLIVDKPMVQLLDDEALAFIPYTGKDFRKAVKELKSQIGQHRNKYLFSHQGVSGVRVGPRDVILKNEYNYNDFGIDFFDIVFNGHYHKMQIHGAGFVIVGSSLQKDFGEREDTKGFWLLDTKKNPQRPTFHKTHAPQFHKYQVDRLDQLPSNLGCDTNDFMWIVSTDLTEAELQGALAGKVNLDHIRIDIEQKKEQRTRTDISINMAIEDQIRRAVEFMLHLTAKELDVDKVVAKAMDLYRRGQQG